MLRRTLIARLAFQQLSLREQRVVQFANTGDPSPPPKQETGESPERGLNPQEGSQIERYITHLSLDTHADILSKLPLLTAECLRNKRALTEIIQAAGAAGLREDLEREALQIAERHRLDRSFLRASTSDERQRGLRALIDTIGDSAQMHTELLTALLGDMDRTLEIAELVEAKIRRYDELMELVTKRSEKYPTWIATVLKDIMCTQATDALSEDTLQFGRTLITEQNIVEVLGLPAQETRFTAEQRRKIYDEVVELAKMRNLFWVIGIDENTPPEKRPQVREDYMRDMRENRRILREHLNEGLRAKAKELIDAYDDESGRWGGAGVDTLKSFDVSADGITDRIVGAIAALQAIRRELVEPKTDQIAKECLPLPTESDYLTQAAGAIRTLRRLESELEEGTNRLKGNEEMPRYLRETRESECYQEIWALDAAERLSRMDEARRNSHPILSELQKLLESYTPKPNEEPIDVREINPEERIAVRQITPDEMRRFSAIVSLMESGPDTVRQLKLGQALDATLSTDQDPTMWEVTVERVDNVVTSVVSLLTMHGVSKLLGLPGRIWKREKEIRTWLEDANPDVRHKALLEYRKLVHCQRELHALLTEPSDRVIREQSSQAYQATAGSNSLGSYDYRTGKIHLNMERIRAEGLKGPSESRVLEHECGHAIVDILCRRSFVFPALLTKAYHELSTSGQHTDEMQTLLYAVATSAWKMPAVPADHQADAVHLHPRMDELVAQYADYQRGWQASRTPDERKLFELFRQSQTEAPTETFTLPPLTRVHLEDDHGHDEGDLAGGEAAPSVPAQPETGDVDSQMEAIEYKMLVANKFLEAHPSLIPQAEEKFTFMDMKRAFEDQRKTFRATGSADAEILRMLKDELELLQTELDKVRAQEADLTSAAASSQGFWKRLNDQIIWISISDILQMFKDAGEDIARMWKRRGEAARHRLGKNISELINDRVPYLGRLKHEYERRDRGSEEEEVSVWEKGLEKIDSDVLQHEMLPRVQHKEQLKAIINLLAKRGRLDWDDEHLWVALENFSRYHMPHAPCKNDAVLRNGYLQKLIADIWRDKDLFEHWRTENDGGIKGGKDHLKAYIDDLSTAGQLRPKLEELLRKFTDMKEGRALATEEEINPHLYEGIIEYAMRNGKMTMEDKFFYLIKGVSVGLLSADRLRTFPGEEFGILNTFPFIDFFYPHNNTLYEARKIADQITELAPGNQYKPGARMTKFLFSKVSFNKGVYDRVNKALKRGENIDHEDIPMYVTQLDYAGVSTLVNYTSGSQWKVSPLAMMNGYVGYNSFMKYFGIKARIGHPPITDRDLAKIVSTIGAYTLWDNTITRESVGGDRGAVPYLSWTQINEQRPVSDTADKKTRDYRNAMNNLTLELCRAAGVREVKGIDIDDYVGVQRNERTAGQLATKYNKTGAEIYTLIQTGPEDFMTKLRNGITANRGAVIEVLKRMEGTLIPEKKEFTYPNVRTF